MRSKEDSYNWDHFSLYLHQTWTWTTTSWPLTCACFFNKFCMMYRYAPPPLRPCGSGASGIKNMAVAKGALFHHLALLFIIWVKCWMIATLTSLSSWKKNKCCRHALSISYWKEKQCAAKSAKQESWFLPQWNEFAWWSVWRRSAVVDENTEKK